MTEQSLTVEAFIALLDTHGADLAAWPEDRRSAAEALLADSAEAVSAFAEARALHASLHSSRIKAPEGLVDRIMTASGAGRPKS
ncbi:hypothetical protein [Novispirillum itersonii]|uniref:hypothetical protein n=1 Tax=Novispirillum itersonii TaxID=189 RepID=UPI00038083E0|nr:hypothetical protein [Novispirillum itersonii]